MSGGFIETGLSKETLDIHRALASLQEDADDVVTFAQKRLRRLFFGAHPFAIDVHGDEASLKSLAPGDLKALHRRLIVAGNAVLAATGDFDPRSIQPQPRRFLERLPAGGLAPVDAGFGGSAGVGDFVETQPRQQAVVAQAFSGPGLLAPDYYVSEVVDELFSGMSSRLFERVREELEGSGLSDERPVQRREPPQDVGDQTLSGGLPVAGWRVCWWITTRRGELT